MPAASDYFKKVGSPGNATTLAAPGHTIGGTSFTVVSTSLWPTDTGVTFAIDTTTLVNGVTTRVPGSYTVWDGVVSSATTITGAVIRYGTDQNYSAGSTTRVYILPTSTRENKIIDGLLAAGLTQAGGMGAIAPTSVASTGPISGTTVTANSGTFTTITVGSQTPSADWTAFGSTPNSVTYNGNRSYTMVFNGTDLTGTVNPGTRIRTTRTVAAPTQSTLLNGTNQYYSKTSPAGTTFTDDFVVGAWIKLTSYGSGAQAIMSRYNGTSGWDFLVTSTGQITLEGYNASSANFSVVTSYQSIPLNKWVHVSAQLDMSAFTATTTTSYVMLDGLDVPALVARGGTNPTVLVQAGNLEIGSRNGGLLPFNGAIAQPFYTSAKVTQANVRTIYSQGITASDISTLSIVSAYSFNGAITDLNTTNANNLTANGSAVATNADSPFGTQASGLISSTLDYAIVQANTFSTNTTMVVQVPEGCTIPTSGGVSAVSYSSTNGYGFPKATAKWRVATILLSNTSATVAGTNQWTSITGVVLTVPIGAWRFGYSANMSLSGSASVLGGYLTGGTAAPTNNLYTQEITVRSYSGASVTDFIVPVSKWTDVIVSAQISYNLYGAVSNGSGTLVVGTNGGQGGTVIFADNAYL